MRLTLTVVDPLGGANADVVLDADPESSVGDIAKELAAHVGYSGGAQIIPIGQHGQQAGSGGAPLAYVDGHPVDPASTIGTSPLREGAVVSLHDPAGCLPGEPTGLVELRVASGPAAGAVHRLGIGRYDIGSGPASYVRIDDPELPSRALTLSVATDGTCQVVAHGDDRNNRDDKDDKDKGGVTLDGEPLDGKDWPLGAQVAVGNTLLELDRYSAAQRRPEVVRRRGRARLQPAAPAPAARAPDPVQAARPAARLRGPAAALADGPDPAGRRGRGRDDLRALVLPDHGSAEPADPLRQLLHGQEARAQVPCEAGQGVQGAQGADREGRSGRAR